MERPAPQHDAESVRVRILAEHAALRSALDELETLSEAFRHGQTGLAAKLRETGKAFVEVFAAHILTEDTLLVAALRTLESGDDLADRLVHEHREQRELIGYLLGRLADDGRPTTLVANEMRSFAHLVRIDMEHEEGTILREDLLCDR